MDDDTPPDVGVPYGEPPTPGEKTPQRPSKTEQAKDQAKDKLKEKAAEPAKQGLKALGKRAAAAIGRALAQAAAAVGSAIVSAIGWPAIAIILIILIIVAVFAFGLMSTASNGYYGKSHPQKAGPSNPEVQKIIQLANTPSRVDGFNKVIFTYPDDRDYLSQGKIDARLAKALTYLAAKHESINISEVIHDYQYMDTNEAGTDTDPQIIKNISAHKDGLAADINFIDFVYKVFEESATCAAATNGLKGDIVYYNDLNEELLRLKCQGNLWDAGKGNSTWHNRPAEAIRIKVADQDCKPPIAHAGNLPDPCTTITDSTDVEIWQKVSRPEARRKTHLAIEELLQLPYESGNLSYYRITQLITFSKERDVDPFYTDGTLDKLYGSPHPGNYGLFALLEAWQALHIGY